MKIIASHNVNSKVDTLQKVSLWNHPGEDILLAHYQ
jgi:hypothetical protein